MDRIRAKTVALCRRVLGRKEREPQTREPRHENAARIADAIFHREQFGQSTTLRQLNAVSGLSQTDTLRAVAELERTRMIEIEKDVHDALESRIELSEQMRRNLQKIAKRDAA